jgi:hypothetical protein
LLRVGCTNLCHHPGRSPLARFKRRTLNRRFDPVSDAWISLEGKSRDVSKVTRQ